MIYNKMNECDIIVTLNPHIAFLRGCTILLPPLAGGAKMWNCRKNHIKWLRRGAQFCYPQIWTLFEHWTAACLASYNCDPHLSTTTTFLAFGKDGDLIWSNLVHLLHYEVKERTEPSPEAKYCGADFSRATTYTPHFWRSMFTHAQCPTN